MIHRFRILINIDGVRDTSLLLSGVTLAPDLTEATAEDRIGEPNFG